MNKKTLILHIGFHKTGTSALQEMFNENRDRLLDVGLFYPRTISGFPAHQELAWSLFDEIPHWVDKKISLNPEEVYNKYVKDIKESNSDIAILSSEDLCTIGADIAKLQQIKSFFIEFDVKIVCYVREQIDFMQSLFHHAIRENEYSNNFKSYLSEKINLETGFFYQRLENWIKVFDKSNVIVRKYDRKCFHGGSVTSDFLHAINANDIVFQRNKISNIGIHPWLVNLCNNIHNHNEISAELKMDLDRNMLKMSKGLPKVDGAKFYLDDADYNLLKKFYLQQNRLLKNKFNVDLL
jgi:hypothetical protein